MSTVRSITVDSVPATPWRNGGGVTREMLAWPDPADWRLRISVADIAADGPFSAFPGVRRWFTLLSGEGVALDFAGARQTLRPGDAPLAFDGAAAPSCRLMRGPVRDLNLMVRGGAGGMADVSPGAVWSAPAGTQAGLFARVAGRWRCGNQQHALPALSLLWFEAPPPGDWRFEPDAPVSVLHSTGATPAPHATTPPRGTAGLALPDGQCRPPEGGDAKRRGGCFTSGWWLHHIPDHATP